MSNVGSRFAGRHKRASVTRAERQRARARASSANAGSTNESDAPVPANPHPFMLAPQLPSFPRDVAIPPHRGAVIGSELAESLSDYTIATKPKAKPGGKKQAGGKATAAKLAGARPVTGKSTAAKAPSAKAASAKATGAKATGGARPAARTASPKPSATPKPSSAPKPSTARSRAAIPPTPELVAAVAPTAASGPQPALTTTAGPPPPPAAPPLPRETANAETVPAEPVAFPVSAPAETAGDGRPLEQRALVKPDQGPIGRLVAWLGRLVPRKRRAALPRARTRLARPASPPAAGPSVAERVAAPAPEPAAAPASGAPIVPPAPAAEPLALPTESILSGRMVLKLSEENSRLRRELDALRATVEKGE
ncbi:MAG TPA: hypothetical protein VI199_11300 [Novosphingobium sp.]